MAIHRPSTPVLRQDVRTLERAEGIDTPVDVEKVSDLTKEANAFSVGLGPTERVVVWDTLLKKPFTNDEVRVVLAHEFGHIAHRHLWKGLAWAALFTFPLAFGVARITARRGGLGNPGLLPYGALVLLLLNVAITPLTNVVSRRYEGEADWSALKAARDPAAQKKLFQQFAATSLQQPDPPTWSYIFFDTHPTAHAAHRDGPGLGAARAAGAAARLSRMAEHAVVIAGGGPTGLMLAGELALAGVDVVIVERRASQELDGSRAGGLHSRTIEVLDQRGIADRFLSEGQVAQVAAFAGIPSGHQRLSHPAPLRARAVAEPHRAHPGRLGRRAGGADLSRTRGDGVRAGRQRRRRRAVRRRVAAGGVSRRVRRRTQRGPQGGGHRVLRLGSDDEQPDRRGRDGRGAGAGHAPHAFGIHSLGKVEYEIREGEVVYGEGGTVRVMVTEEHVGPASEPTLRDLSEALIAVYGTDYGVHSPTWISRFTDLTRQAAAYRNGRILLAGDAAHVHSPVGGQGLNTGVQDAVNLGWKLAQVVNGTSPDSLLDTYHAERHPVAARVLRNTMAQVALFAPGRPHRGSCATRSPSCSAWTSRAGGSAR